MSNNTTSASRLAAAYPHIAHALEPVTELIRELERRKFPNYCQLEARLGVLTPDGSVFQSGVDASFVSRILCRLKVSDDFSVLPWTQQLDRYYLLPSGLQVRTTTETVHSADAPEITCAVTHFIKTSLGHVDLKWQTEVPKSLQASEEGELFNVRVSLKQEEPLFEDELQDRVDDLHVNRLKQRETFRYASACAAHLLWDFDVTQLYQATKYDDAVACLKAGHITQYELGVRCREPMEHLKHMGGDHARLAASLLLKAADFFQMDGGPCPAATGSTLVVL
jgi:hypothetical protein